MIALPGPLWRLAWLGAGLLAAAPALAADPCAAPSSTAAATGLAGRIAMIACREHALWYRPFIDGNGRLASMTVSEAETARLADGLTPAWKRVADYWRGSGLLSAMAGFPGASECAYASNDGYPSPACRAFLVDRPWSAAFVSYVLVQAGAPNFRASPSHFDYVREAFLSSGTAAYRLADPDLEAPATGDLLCFVRGAGSVTGYPGLRAFIAGGAGGRLAMHCDIVVGAGDGRLYAVGGNVLQGVTMRVLNLNRNGMLWALPRGSNLGCAPDHEAVCSFNRQNWAALLKLRPSTSTPASIPTPTPTPAPLPAAPRQDAAPMPSVTPACCVHCVVGAQPPVPRCKAGADADRLLH